MVGEKSPLHSSSRQAGVLKANGWCAMPLAFSIFSHTAGAMNIAEIAASGPRDKREDRAENQEHPYGKCQRGPNTLLERCNENGRYPPTNENRQDSHANLRRGRPTSLFQIPPKSRLVLHRVGEDHVALPRFNVLQPPILFMIVRH